MATPGSGRGSDIAGAAPPPGQPEQVNQLVVIGASAGGVEALSRLLATLPVPFPAPIVVAQHLDPHRESHLREVLAPASTLPVRTVTDHEALVAGHVYVVPADRHVAITNHDVSVLSTRAGVPDRPKPSVDLLLATAAEVFGDGLYAVILTGTGTDGADGARAVKAAGGTVVIQNPETASFPGMPLSLAPTTVDIVANLEAIGPLLHDLLTGAYTPPLPDQDRRMRALLEQLRQRSGIDFSQYRQPTIQRRLQRRMADTGAASLDEYLRYLQRHPDEYHRLANSFLVKVTDFFRDPDLFAYLHERVIPELMADLTGTERSHRDAQRGGWAPPPWDRELRIWSAGCATGEEAYSLAILVAETLGDQLASARVRIFATDVDADAIAFGRRGVYPASALRQLTPDQINRYFARLNGAYEVKRFIRKLVVFGEHDLAQRAPFPHIDLALCRNVLIYFTPELQRRALQLFAYSLRDGAQLVLGKSETTTPLPEYFTLEHARLRVFRRTGERVLMPPSHLRDSSLLRPAVPSPRPIVARAELGLTHLPNARASAQTTVERAERLLLDLPVGVVVVDRRYDIQAINAMARHLLGIHTSAIGDDFVHLAHRLPSDRLRAAIDGAFQGALTVERLETQAIGAAGYTTRLLELRCYPQPRTEVSDQVERVTIMVSDVTDARPEPAEPAASVAAPDALAQLAEAAQRLARLPLDTRPPPVTDDALRAARTALRTAREEIERLTQLAQALDAARRELLAANADLAATNAQLCSLNEDLLVSSEEAQAAVEEIETLAEEQQATNEELETLNEELQSTIEELNTANDDLEARGRELQTTALALEAERSRLEAVLASMADAVLVVDGAGQPVLTNPAYDRTFGGPGATLVPLDEGGQPLPAEATPQQRAARGEAGTVRFARTSHGEAPRWYEATIQPIQATGQDGGVIVIRDLGQPGSDRGERSGRQRGSRRRQA